MFLPRRGIIRGTPHAVSQNADIPLTAEGDLVAHLVGCARVGGLHEFRPFLVRLRRRDGLLEFPDGRPQRVDLALVVEMCIRDRRMAVWREILSAIW